MLKTLHILFLWSAAVAVILAFTIGQDRQPHLSSANNIPPDSLVKRADALLKSSPDSALMIYDRAAEAFRIDKNWTQWFECINKMRDIHKTARKYQASINHMREAAQTAIVQIGETDTITAKVLMRLGTAYEIAGKYDSALMVYQQAVSVFELHQIEDATVATLQKNIGNIYGRRMDYQQATDRLSEALRIRLQLNDQNVAARIYNDLGIVYKNWKDFPKALEQYNKALKLINPEDSFKPVVLTNIADSYKGLELYDKALDFLLQALQQFTREYGPEHEYVSEVHHSIADLAQQQGKTEEAIKQFELALSIAHKLYGSKHRDITDIYSAMADTYAANGQYAKALQNCQQALTALLPSFNDSSATVNPSEKQFIPDPWLFTVLQSKGKMWHNQYRTAPDTGYLHHALSCFSLAAKHINYLRRSYSSELSKLKLAELTYNNFEQGMQVVAELYQQTGNSSWVDTALLFSEQYKAAVLLESVKDNEARLFANIPPELLDRDLQLRETLAQTEQQLFDQQQLQAPPDSLEKLNKQLFDLRKQSQQLGNRIEREFPQYAKLKFETTTPATKDISGKLLDKQTAFIEYFTADSAIYAIVITKQKVQFMVFNKDSTFERRIETLRELLAQPTYAQRNPKEAYRQFAENANSLYQTLLHQPLSQLPDDITRLIIVPDGKMGYLPFEALLTALPDTPQPVFRDLIPFYLIQKYAVSYGTSATLLLEQQHPKQKRATQLLAAYSPDYSRPDSLSNAKSAMAELKGAAQEVQQITQLTGGRAFTGSEATKSQFKDQAGNYQILHLAMHGVVNDENPMYSHLLFTQSPTTPNEYAQLHTYELYTMNLRADLAVLSACSTGEGRALRGEGIMSLSRGFIYAGCPSIVMSLWKAADDGTQKIMVHFYQALLQHTGKDIALQQAKLQYLSNADQITAHPFYWATFVLLGNANAIETGTNRWYWVVLLLALGGVIWATRKWWMHTLRNKKQA